MQRQLAVAVASLCVLAAAPAQAVVRGDNLIANPGAEADVGSTDGGCGGDLDVSSWDPETETFSAVQYGTGGYPSLADSARIGGGSNLFTGGCPTGAVSTGEQTVALPEAAPEIDAGQVTATLTGYLGGFSSQEDNAVVEAFFVGAGGTDLGNPGADLVIGPVTAADRGSVTDLLFRSATGGVPPGTRSILTRLKLTRLAGSANDGYADNLSLTLTSSGTGPGPGPGPAPVTPPPVLGSAVNGEAVKGVVLVQVPGGQFVPLEELSQVPVGSIFDTRRGTVRLTSARDGAGNTQTGEFGGGIFQVLQAGGASSAGVTELRLKGGDFSRCGKRRSAQSGVARAALSRRAVRRLRANAGGRFRTRGRNSAATVRGTIWETIDRCDGTLTKVRRGRVAVRDFRRKKTVIVRAGKSYLARAR